MKYWDKFSNYILFNIIKRIYHVLRGGAFFSSFQFNFSNWCNQRTQFSFVICMERKELPTNPNNKLNQLAQDLVGQSKPTKTTKLIYICWFSWIRRQSNVWKECPPAPKIYQHFRTYDCMFKCFLFFSFCAFCSHPCIYTTCTSINNETILNLSET